MNYQVLLEYYSRGTKIEDVEAEMLELELYSQIESIKTSSSEHCLEIAPDHICKASLVSSGSRWITCLASVLDRISKPNSGQDYRGTKVFNELIKCGYRIVS